MSCVLGADLSTIAIDLVKLDEETNEAEWTHLHLDGKTALERLRRVPLVMPSWSWYDDVYLVAVEEPMSRGQAGTSAKLNRVLGAVTACIPAMLETWLVRPADWRKELGLPGRATKEECAERVHLLRSEAHDDRLIQKYAPDAGDRVPRGLDAPPPIWPQDAFDAYAVAYYARELNARALGARVV